MSGEDVCADSAGAVIDQGSINPSINPGLGLYDNRSIRLVGICYSVRLSDDNVD